MSFFQKFFPRVTVLDDAKSGRRGFAAWLETLIFLLVFLVQTTLESIPLAIVVVLIIVLNKDFHSVIAGELPMSSFISSIDIDSRIMLPSLFFTFVTILVALFYCTKIEKRPLKSLGFRKNGALGEYGIGLVIGIVMFAAAVGLTALAGGLTVKAVGYGAAWIIPIYFIGYVIQGMSEEVLCRGYYMVSVTRKNEIGLAVILSSVIFALLHVANPGFGILPFVNIVLFGLLMASYFLKRGSIWGVAAIHSVWNFAEGNVFGISVSGTDATPSLMTTVVTDGAELWNGGTFGLEGGLGVTIVLFAALLVIIFLVPAKKTELAPVGVEEPVDTVDTAETTAE